MPRFSQLRLALVNFVFHLLNLSGAWRLRWCSSRHSLMRLAALQ
jgi:hypothetical protein